MVENGEIGLRAAIKELLDEYDRCCLKRRPGVELAADELRKIVAEFEAYPGCGIPVAAFRFQLLAEGFIGEE